jgi:proteasome lid subunit RPN8/RPN11
VDDCPGAFIPVCSRGIVIARLALTFAVLLELQLKTPDKPLSPPEVLILPPGLEDQIKIHLLNAAPNEGVGLLAALPRLNGGPVEAVHFYPGSNIAASPVTRFVMKPEEVLAAKRDIRQNGWELGAIVHSHRFGPATPSATDLAEAYYPDALMMIASIPGEKMDPAQVNFAKCDDPDALMVTVSFARQPATLCAWHIEQTQGQKIVRGVRIESGVG